MSQRRCPGPLCPSPLSRGCTRWAGPAAAPTRPPQPRAPPAARRSPASGLPGPAAERAKPLSPLNSGEVPWPGRFVGPRVSRASPARPWAAGGRGAAPQALPGPRSLTPRAGPSTGSTAPRKAAAGTDRDRPERGGTSRGRERVVEQAGGGGAREPGVPDGRAGKRPLCLPAGTRCPLPGPRSSPCSEGRQCFVSFLAPSKNGSRWL